MKMIFAFLGVLLLTPDMSLCQPQSINLDVASDAPELFAPGFISTGMYERDLAISPDGNEMIYTLGDEKN